MIRASADDTLCEIPVMPCCTLKPFALTARHNNLIRRTSPMKKMLTGVLGAGALVVLLALTQDDPLQPLRAAIAEVGLRVDKLEAAAGDGSGASTSGANAQAPARKMVLVSVHNTDKGDADASEIADLQQQCDALMNTVNSKADSVASDLGNAGGGGVTYVRGGVTGWNESGGGSAVGGNAAAVAQAAGDRQTEERYATLHAIKLQQLQALKDAANTPNQLILGHDGQTIITLTSKVDLSSALNNIPVGATVTWTGTRVSADNNSESWRIDSISQVK